MYGRDKNKRVLKIWKRTFLALVLAVFIIAIAGFCLWLEPNRMYEDTVDGHLENARVAPTPELMKQEIGFALEGTNELDLEDDDYGAWLPWFKTEQVRVGYQREYLLNITERLDHLIVWRDTTEAPEQEMKDVYNEKLENIREYLYIEHEDGEPKDILQDAWFAKEHAFVYLSSSILLILICAVMAWGAVFIPLDMKYNII